jgi:hypothetical protein
VARIVYRAALKLVGGASFPPHNGAWGPTITPLVKGTPVVERSGETKKREAGDYGDYEGHPEKRARLTEPEATRGNVELASIVDMAPTGEGEGDREAWAP